MFGKFDYYLLGAITKSLKQYPIIKPTADGALQRWEKYSKRWGSNIDPKGKKVLDFGSGYGELIVAAKLLGASKVVGIENHIPYVEVSNEFISNAGVRVDVINQDALTYKSKEMFDLILSTECFEHYRDPELAWQTMRKLLAPDGKIAVLFGNSYYGPYFDHMDAMFKLPIPYRQIIFNESAMLKRYRQPAYISRYSKKDQNTSKPAFYEDLTLNRITLSRFKQGANQANLKITFKNENYQFSEKSYLRLLKPVSDTVLKIPFVNEFSFISGAYILEKNNDKFE